MVGCRVRRCDHRSETDYACFINIKSSKLVHLHWSIGPFLIIVPSIVAVRAPGMETVVSAFFGNEALVWITGGLLLFIGLLIIAHHQ